MPRPSVLSPRTLGHDLADIATARRLTAGQRVSRRRRGHARGRGRRLGRLALGVAAATALLGAAVGGVQWALVSPRFAVQASDVDVTGLSRLTREEVLSAAGLEGARNLLRLDPVAMVGGIEALPQVRRAEVIRRLPNRVQIVIEERRPFTLVHAGRLHWIDESGVAMGPEPRAVSAPMPVLSGLSAEELAAAGRAPSPRMTAGLALLRVLLRTGGPLVGQISEVDVSRGDGPVLYTLDGIEVRLGAEDWEARIARLLGVLAQLSSTGEAVSAIDLRFRNQIILKPAGR